MKTKLLMAGVLTSMFMASAFAQSSTDTPKVDQRQVNQEKRIEQGVKSGALTEKEATNLEKRQDKIEQHKQAAKADGVVTPKERAKLRNEQDRASHAIYRKKHNKRTASTN